MTYGQPYKLWYDKPASTWTEALPLGNGRLGAMIFGNPAIEQIQLNEKLCGQVSQTIIPIRSTEIFCPK